MLTVSGRRLEVTSLTVSFILSPSLPNEALALDRRLRTGKITNAHKQNKFSGQSSSILDLRIVQRSGISTFIAISSKLTEFFQRQVIGGWGIIELQRVGIFVFQLLRDRCSKVDVCIPLLLSPSELHSLAVHQSRSFSKLQKSGHTFKSTFSTFDFVFLSL